VQGIVGASSKVVLVLVTALFVAAPAPVATGAEPAGSFRVLADQVAGLFPAVDTQVIEVGEGQVTVASGRAQGVTPGLELIAVREGRELYHPTTKKLLGRTEETLGRLVVVTSFEQYAVASATPEVLARLQPGDKVRVPPGKVPLSFVVLGASRTPTMEAATSELVQDLERTGRFQIRFAEEVAIWLAQERIAPEAFMRGQGLRPATERFKLGHLLVLHFTSQQGKPFMDLRLFSPTLEAPVLQHALFVPPSLKASPGRQFSTATGAQPDKVERRSLLTRLLSGDFEPNRYSAGAAAIPIRALATFPYLVTSMDVAVAPADRLPRIVVTDGQRVFVYRLKEQVLEPEWTHDKLMVGQILSVQLADLDADGVLEVVVNRQDLKVGMLSYILTTRNGRPALLAGDIPLLLLAVDEAGDGVNRSLWAQTYDAEKFWTLGTATRYVLKKDDIAPAGRVLVHSTFRPTGATFSNIAGAERALAFVDEQSRLVVASAVGQEVWRSQSAVGGGFAYGQTRIMMMNMQVDKVFKMEPNPVSVDLDGDGIQEIVVPMNQDEQGRMAVVFRGPAGYRMQVVNSGFEGLVSGVGAISGEGSPALVAAVLRRKGILKTGGDTQIIITVSE
jgi:hypothetical protein